MVNVYRLNGINNTRIAEEIIDQEIVDADWLSLCYCQSAMTLDVKSNTNKISEWKAFTEIESLLAILIKDASKTLDNFFNSSGSKDQTMRTNMIFHS